MNRISDLRAERGWSQGRLAKELGTSQQQVARYESDGSDLKASVLKGLSKTFDVSISYILGLTDRKHEQVVPDKSVLSMPEQELIGLFRACTPKWQDHVLMSAKSAASESRLELQGEATRASAKPASPG